MASITNTLYALYVRFMVWLGAEPPPGYEHLLPGEGVPREYTLQTGDTLFSVARKFGVHYDLIAEANAIEDPETLQPGRTLIIPPIDWDLSSGPLIQPQPEPTLEVAETSPPVLLDESIKELPLVPPLAEPDQPVEVEATPEEPALPSQEPILPSDEPEWLTSIEPSPEAETVGDILSATESIPASDEIEWLVATDEPLAPAEAQPPPTEITADVEKVPPAPTEVQPSTEKVTLEETRPTPVETPILAEPESPTTPVTDVSAKEEMAFRYEVQRGDTLSAIARRYSITIKALVEANNIPDPNRIFPGQKLIIPGYPSPIPPLQPEPEPETQPRPETDHFIYTVVRGDTLSAIAKRYSITLRQLVEANDIENPDLIRVGQRLIISGAAPTPEPEPEPEPEPHPTPVIDPNFPPIGPIENVRALYVSYFAIGHAEFREHIFKLLDTTEFNAVVIDAKGDHGWISYPSQISMAQEIGAARPTAKDFDEVMAQLKTRGIYTIARVVTFKDNPLAKSYPEFAAKIQGGGEIWQDREQLSWTDPFLRPVWDYNIQIAVEAAQKGFDEIQFDYVRFPTSSQAGVPQFSQEATKEVRVAAISGFLSAARGQLKPLGVKMAADTFGYTCWRKDDTLIGQDIDRLGQYLDVLSPMLYPSTFGSGIPGYKMAVAHPYEIVFESAKRAVERVNRFGCTVRPWIQDFPDYRFDRRVYGKEEIQAQIKGCFDSGSDGFMVWDPRVKYTDGAYAPVIGSP